jgi:hypothetical protein
VSSCKQACFAVAKTSPAQSGQIVVRAGGFAAAWREGRVPLGPLAPEVPLVAEDPLEPDELLELPLSEEHARIARTAPIEKTQRKCFMKPSGRSHSLPRQ